MGGGWVRGWGLVIGVGMKRGGERNAHAARARGRSGGQTEYLFGASPQSKHWARGEQVAGNELLLVSFRRRLM